MVCQEGAEGLTVGVRSRGGELGRNLLARSIQVFLMAECVGIGTRLVTNRRLCFSGKASLVVSKESRQLMFVQLDTEFIPGSRPRRT